MRQTPKVLEVQERARGPDLYHHAKLEDCDTEVGLIIVLQRNIVLEFGKITKNNGHYAVQGHSSSPILERLLLPISD